MLTRFSVMCISEMSSWIIRIRDFVKATFLAHKFALRCTGRIIH